MYDSSGDLYNIFHQKGPGELKMIADTAKLNRDAMYSEPS